MCRSWNEALHPLREAMLFLKWGKRYKHGRGEVRKDVEKALDSFLKGAERGSSLAMVDAGLLRWELGEWEEAVRLYRRAAEVGDVGGMCNLGIACLQVQPPNTKEAVKWLYKAATAGHARAQYQLALCLHQGCGTDRHLSEAARWYLRAAERGYARAMYNVSLCYSLGQGFHKSHRLAKKWMKQAADHGLSKAQFEHGLSLFSVGEMMEAAVYLKLASRAGEASAAPLQNIIDLRLSAASRDRVRVLANNWRALPSMHRSRAA